MTNKKACFNPQKFAIRATNEYSHFANLSAISCLKSPYPKKL
jgi:hypothetical protein